MLVLLFHAFYVVSATAISAGVSGPGTIFGDGAVGVDLFFVISGFVMPLSVARVDGWHGVVGFLLGRFIRLAPLFYVVGAAACAIAAARGVPYPWERVATGLTILPVGREYHGAPLHQGWTLAFEMAFYLIVAVAVLAAPRRRYAALLAALITLCPLPVAMPIEYATGRFFANGIVLEFAFGVGVYVLWEAGHLARLPAITVAAALAGAALLGVQIAVGYQHGNLMAVVDDATSLQRAIDWGLPSAFILAGLLLWSPKQGLASRAGQTLGEISYSLYLVHVLVLDALAPLLVGRLPPPVVVALCVAASVAAGSAVHKLVEAPMLRTMRGRLERRLAYAS